MRLKTDEITQQFSLTLFVSVRCGGAAVPLWSDCFTNEKSLQFLVSLIREVSKSFRGLYCLPFDNLSLSLSLSVTLSYSFPLLSLSLLLSFSLSLCQSFSLSDR